jgi:hypothetical protein
MRPRRRLLLSIILLLSCQDAEPADPDRSIELFFSPRAGDEFVTCDEEPFSGKPLIDLRFYVYDVRLVTEDGDQHAVEIFDDSPFQGSGVALMDFENDAGKCVGTPAANKSIKGTIAAEPGAQPARYTGLRFRIGVPPELDRLPASELSPPLGDPWLHQGGANGHFFLTAWAEFGAGPVGIYLRSAGDRSNRPEVILDGFDLEDSSIVVDWGALFGALEIPACTPGPANPCICSSNPAEPLCEVLMPRLGIAVPGGEPTDQTVFRLE